ncbi:3-dehydroquinate dehydratase, type I, partial [human gut metagenome]
TVVRIRTLEIGSGMPKICVPVVGKTEKEILEGAERAKAAKPDLVEFRAITVRMYLPSKLLPTKLAGVYSSLTRQEAFLVGWRLYKIRM